jgi:hypothetical protein
MNGIRLQRVLGSALLGLAVFGTWAYCVNFEYPERRLTSALSQGVFSFVFSLIVMSITEATFAVLAGRRLQVPLAIAVPVLISIGCASLIHLVVQTPSIVLTLLGPALLGTAYQTAYVLNLRRLAASTRAHETRDAGRSPVDRVATAER